MKPNKLTNKLIKSALRELDIHDDYEIGCVIGFVMRESIDDNRKNIVNVDSFVRGIITGIKG